MTLPFDQSLGKSHPFVIGKNVHSWICDPRNSTPVPYVDLAERDADPNTNEPENIGKAFQVGTLGNAAVFTLLAVSPRVWSPNIFAGDDQDLANVLGFGNISGGNNIVMSSGDEIEILNGFVEFTEIAAPPLTPAINKGRLYVQDISSNTSLIFKDPAGFELNLSQAVTNAGTSTDNALARFDLATGRVIQSSFARLNDTGQLTLSPTGFSTPDSLLHLHDASAGAVTALAGTTLTVENDNDVYISILAPDARKKGVLFGSPSNNDEGFILLDENGQLDIATATVPRMRIKSSGEVAIGGGAGDTIDGILHVRGVTAGAVTAAPNTVLTVENSADAYITILTPNASQKGILFGDVENNDAGYITYDNLDVMSFGTAGADRLTLSAADVDVLNKLIINVTDPTADQHAATKKYVDDQILTKDTFLELNDTPASYSGQEGRVVQVNGGPTALEFGQQLRTTDSPSFAQLNIDNLRLDGNTLSTTNTNGDLLLAPNGTGKIEITGDVNIWDGSTVGTGNLVVGNNSGDSKVHIIDGSAGVVAAPTNTVLTVENDNNCLISILAPNLNEKGIVFGDPSNNDRGAVILDQAGDLALTTIGFPRLIILSTGEVGIGIDTAFDSILHVRNDNAGIISAPTNTVITVENNNDAFVSFLTPNANAKGLVFGDVADNDAGSIKYLSNDDLVFRTSAADQFKINSTAIDVFTKKIINVVDPTANQDAATKKYVDDQILTKDTFLELTDTPATYSGKALQIAQVNAGETALEFIENKIGDFVGPGSSTDNAIVRFDGVTGKLGQNSLTTIADSGQMTVDSTDSFPLIVKMNAIPANASLISIQDFIPRVRVGYFGNDVGLANGITEAQIGAITNGGVAIAARGNFAGGGIKFYTPNTALDTLIERISIADMTGNVRIGAGSAAGLFDVSNSLTGTPSQVGHYLTFSASIFTDDNTAMDGTANNMVFNSIAQPTLAASNTGVTTVNAATLFLNPPVAGTNQTITNAYALWANGQTRFDDSMLLLGALNIQTTDAITAFIQNTSGAQRTVFQAAGTNKNFVDILTAGAGANCLRFGDSGGVDWSYGAGSTGPASDTLVWANGSTLATNPRMFLTASGDLNIWDGSTVGTGKLFVGNDSGDSQVHIFGGSAGVVTAGVDTLLTLENDGAAFLSILTPDANESGILFGMPSSAVDGAILFNNTGTLEGFQFRVNNNVTEMTLTSSGLLGIGLSSTVPDSRLHVHKATAGVVSAAIDTILTIENNADAFLSFLTPNGNIKGIIFGDVEDNDVGSIKYLNNDDLAFETSAATHFIINATEINAVTKKIVNVVDPIADQDAATKKYVDDQILTQDTFLELTDTPSSYSGEGLNFVRVNAGATALEFASGVGDVVGPGSAVDNSVPTFDLTTGKLIQDPNILFLTGGNAGIGIPVPLFDLHIRQASANDPSAVMIGDTFDRLKLGFQMAVLPVANVDYAQVFADGTGGDFHISSRTNIDSDMTFYTGDGTGNVGVHRMKISGGSAAASKISMWDGSTIGTGQLTIGTGTAVAGSAITIENAAALICGQLSGGAGKWQIATLGGVVRFGSVFPTSVGITCGNGAPVRMQWDPIDGRVRIFNGITTRKSNLADANYTVLFTDYRVAVTSITAARTITIPSTEIDKGSATEAREWVFKDESGNVSGSNTITILTGGSETIDGATTLVLDTPYFDFKLYSNGTNLYVEAA